MKFERCFDAEVVNMDVLSEDYSKVDIGGDIKLAKNSFTPPPPPPPPPPPINLNSVLVLHLFLCFSLSCFSQIDI